MLSVVMLNVIMLNVFMLNVIMLNVFMLNVIMLNVFMLNVVALNRCKCLCSSSTVVENSIHNKRLRGLIPPATSVAMRKKVAKNT